MGEFLTIGLAVAIGISVLVAGLLAAWRLIPRPEAPPDLQSLYAEVQANRTMILDLTDKYETVTQRARARGRKKKVWEEEDAPESAPAAAPAPPAPESKAELRARARATYPQLVR